MNKEYIASEYRRLHALKKFSGACLQNHLPEIKALIKEYDCNSVLDYGCGKATCHKKAALPNVTLYDPYYEPYSKKPTDDMLFDMVICTDVLEHIPEDEVGKVLHELMFFTHKVLFLAICTKPAKKTFANSENVHLTVRPKEWWESMLSTAKDIKIVRKYT
jgi:hypothetical protein